MTRTTVEARNAVRDPAEQDLARWEAIRTRDERADGAFVYGVVTTGIFCRPSCRSRRPRRENVRYFATSTDAETEGFRACKRCGPAGTSRRRVEAVTAACRVIEQSPESVPLAVLARAVGWSPSHLHRAFKAEIGLTPKEYGDARRAGRARRALDDSAAITGAIHDAGYGSTSRYYEHAAARIGMTPTEHRARAPGVEIRYALGASSLGAVLVAVTERGICAVHLGDDAGALVDELHDRFSRASLARDDDLTALVARVVELVERPGGEHPLPLDIRGTSFQERVWRALTDLRAGTTITYGALADRIGAPSAARAVAGACAANPLAVVVPCHRVLRSDGAPSGYRWGAERKRILLARERAALGGSEGTEGGTHAGTDR